MTRRCASVLPTRLAWLLALGVILAGQGRAAGGLVSEIYSFRVITTGISQAAVDDVEQNVFMRVSNATTLNATPGDPVDDSQALFEFFVLAGAPSSMSVAEIYFEDGVLRVSDDPASPTFFFSPPPTEDPAAGVSFSEGATPAQLPDHNNVTPAFEVDHYLFSADAENPSPEYGINAGETLGVSFLLQTDLKFDLTGDDSVVDIYDVLAALEAGFSNPQPGTGKSIRVGIHVQGLGNPDESASAIAVPEPVAVVRLVSLTAVLAAAFGICRIFRIGAAI